MTTPKPCKMSLATGTLIELFRTTPPPPLARRQEAVRSIPPPPLHPPPLTILKMVPPPPLPSHLNRIGPTAAALLSGGQGTANSGHGTTNQPRNAKGVSETGYQDTARGQGRKGSSKTARLNHCGPRDGRSRDTADGPLSRSRDTADGSASRSRDAVDSPLSRSRDSEVTDDAAEEAELVDVLKHLVNLFTMTSQVKAALGRVRLKADDTGQTSRDCSWCVSE
ncbi:uncharacterized protein LOC122375692 [Amphibalanus amphitrite]|uniref:uncharacterized protein LOC122375692 n=1 Tax=Amphibalanus amphitrite TaxID=1232801 RepID=UPI001C9295C8|nr:uncharacterized protein LOC122375692 [Amphibalanus amphitrite]